MKKNFDPHDCDIDDIVFPDETNAVWFLAFFFFFFILFLIVAGISIAIFLVI
jgi:hypothetical protein